MRTFPYRWSFAAAALVLFGACADSPMQVEEGTPVPVSLFSVAPDPSTTMDGVTVTVTGPGIPQALVFNLGKPSSTGEAQKSFDIPAGPARVFIARAYAGAVQTHESRPDTTDISSAGASVNLTLKKLVGDSGINTTVQDFAVEVDDADPFVAATTTTTASKGTSVPFSVKVTEAFGAKKGDPVSGVVVTWASENPGIVQVGSGSCTTGSNGACAITAMVPQSAKTGGTAGVVASYAGIAHRVGLTVQ